MNARAARGAKFRLVKRNAYWAHEILGPLNHARVALRGRRAAEGKKQVAGKWSQVRSRLAERNA
jgi:hypothetical protein